MFGGTIKSGASFQLTEKSTVFVNLGYLSRTPQFSNVIDNNTNTFFQEIVNEKISAIEGGYTYSNNNFGLNLNGGATLFFTTLTRVWLPIISSLSLIAPILLNLFDYTDAYLYNYLKFRFRLLNNHYFF